MIAIQTHRGLTLIELLAATVLLALLSTACASLLRIVRPLRADARTDDDPVSVFELEHFVDQVLLDSTTRAHCEPAGVDITLLWPDAASRSPVRVRRLADTSELAAGASNWLGFSCRGLVVWRWLPVRRESVP